MNMFNVNLKTLSVVVPCYNEEATLLLFYEEMLKQISSLMKTGVLEDYEFVFVDDGSTDSSVSLLRDFASRDERVRSMLEVVSAGEVDCAGTRRVTRKGEPPVRSFFCYL